VVCREGLERGWGLAWRLLHTLGRAEGEAWEDVDALQLACSVYDKKNTGNSPWGHPELNPHPRRKFNSETSINLFILM
jgi:hypothetical protein